MVGSWAEHRECSGCLGHTRVGSTPLLFQMVLTAYLVSTVSSLGEGRSGWDQLSNPANKPQSFTVITCTTISVTIVNNQTTTKTKTCSRSKNTTKAKQSTKALTTHTHTHTYIYIYIYIYIYTSIYQHQGEKSRPEGRGKGRGRRIRIMERKISAGWTGIITQITELIFPTNHTLRATQQAT